MNEWEFGKELVTSTKRKTKKNPPSKKVRRGGWGEVVTVYHVA